MSTCQQVIDSALVRSGLQSIYDPDDGVVVTAAFRELNLMLDAWTAEVGPLFNVVDSFTGAPTPGFTLVGGQSLYTLGPSNLLGIRPPSIADIFLLDGNSVSYYIEIIGLDEYVRLIYKIAPGRPNKCYVNYNAGNVVLNFYPTPSYADQCHVMYNQALTAFVTPQDTVSFPPGYEDCFINNLSVRLANFFGKQPPAWVVSAATWGKSVISANNRQINLLQTVLPTQKSRFFNILTGGT